MNRNELFNLIFFAFILCIVLAIVRMQTSSTGLITIMLLAAGIWLGWDSIKMMGYKSCNCAKQNTETSNKSMDTHSSVQVIESPNEPEKAIDNPEGHVDIAIHNEDDIRTIYTNSGCIADNQLCNRMKYTGAQAKMSQDIRARYNKYTLMPYLEEEMRENEDLHWWEDDSLEELM